MCGKFQLGEMVKSIAGRDTGKYYIVVKIDNEKYVQVADGDKKRLERPKRKNVKHLKPAGFVHKELQIWLSNGKRVRNEDN